MFNIIQKNWGKVIGSFLVGLIFLGVSFTPFSGVVKIGMQHAVTIFGLSVLLAMPTILLISNSRFAGDPEKITESYVATSLSERFTVFIAISAVNLIVILISSAGVLWIVNVYFPFGDLQRPDQYLLITLEWFTKGALLDLMESFEIELTSFEPSSYGLIFNGLEFLYRSTYGVYLAYNFTTFLVFSRHAKKLGWKTKYVTTVE